MPRKNKISMCGIHIVIFALLLAGFPVDTTHAKFMFVSNGGDVQGQGVYIDITIEDVSVNTFEVSRGDQVVFTVTLKNRGEVVEDYIMLRLYSGKRLLAEKIIFPDRWDVKNMAKFDFVWDTKDVETGSYPVRVEAFMLSDQDEWDNRYEIPKKIAVR